jgi:23S rRNA (adenine2503-C2)-methyltransferase
MTDLPDDLRRKLKDKFHITRPVMLDSRRSPTDGTTKYLLKLEDGNTIETVFLPEKARGTICLSSQVGCKFSCSFCASAPFGFVRNLKASEILDEVLFVRTKNPDAAITNLVFMGIGEPFDNYDNVMRAIRIFNDKDAFNIGARRITVSTCGVLPGMKKFSDEGLQIELSVSLHCAEDAVRSKIVPVNKRYPLKELIAACREYTARTDRVITFEYILIRGVNSSRQDALKLAALLKGLKCKVNTISYNKIKALDYDEPSARDIRLFIDILKDKGVNVMHRKSRGEDIDAGCGQLRISKL